MPAEKTPAKLPSRGRANDGLKKLFQKAEIVDDDCDCCAQCGVLLPTRNTPLVIMMSAAPEAWHALRDTVVTTMGERHFDLALKSTTFHDLGTAARIVAELMLVRCMACDQPVCIACREGDWRDATCSACLVSEQGGTSPPAENPATASSTPAAAPSIVDAFDATNDVGDIYRFIAGYTDDEVGELCSAYPLDEIDLVGEDIAQLHKLDRVTYLATILAGYPKVRQAHPRLGLPDLDHGRLTELLLPRLTCYLGGVRDQGLRGDQPLAPAVCKRLYDFGKDLMVHDRSRDAIACFEVHAQVPTPHHEGEFWLTSCWFNLANEQKDPATIEKAKQLAHDLANDPAKVAGSQRPALNRMLDRLEGLSGEIAAAQAPVEEAAAYHGSGPSTAELTRLAGIAEAYIRKEPAADPLSAMMAELIGGGLTQSGYRAVAGGAIQREGNMMNDMRILSVAQCLKPHMQSIDDSAGPEVVAKLVMKAVLHYLALAPVERLFLAPYRQQSGAHATGFDELAPDEKCRVLTGMENLLLEVYEELPDGGVITDELIVGKVDKVTRVS